MIAGAARISRRAALAGLLGYAAAGLPWGRAAAALGPGAIDFSYAGFGGGGVPIPAVPVRLAVRPSGGPDDTPLLQAAIDAVSARAPDAEGFRGAIRLAPGRFNLDGQLRIRTGGIVLRGAGSGGATTLVATGQDRRTLIVVGGDAVPALGQSRPIQGDVAVGSMILPLDSVEGLAPGISVSVVRPSTAEWIASLGMDQAAGHFADQRLHWKPGSRDLRWHRTIVAVDAAAREVRLDAPITAALEARFGGGTLSAWTGPPPPRLIGIEDLVLESAYDRNRPKDEEHSWIAIAIDRAEDLWVRGVVARHFVASAVRVGHGARRVTVEDVHYRQPVSEIGGYRRQSFVVEGQQVLVRRCTCEQGLNDFSSGLLAAGPNVFLDCSARDALGRAGAFESWSAGTLYENVAVEGAPLQLAFDIERTQSGGWTAGNSLIWNGQAPAILADATPGAPNAARTGPAGMYEAQLAHRLGRLPPPPSVASQAAAPLFSYEAPPKPRPPSRTPAVEIVNGRFAIGNRLVWGGAANDAWWRGQTSPAAALDHGRSITRFVPGRTGPGLTEDLEAFAAELAAQGTPFYQSGPGLWYDRRRDDHSIHRQPDGNVWAPFYEMPWARSGQGQAWDGLSLYDLSRFNPWYFDRTERFAELCDANALLLFHNLHNTHNLLEIVPHWVDYPWRPANNVNDTGLPEPMPIEPRGRIHLASEVYNVDHAPRAALHRAYIRQVLERIGRVRNLLLGVGFQYSGPLAFQQFFMDTVREWERENRARVRIALTASKDVTDAILADPIRSPQVAVIDTRYWQYRPDGTLWAPKGGRNKAFRESVTEDFGRMGDHAPATTPEQAYAQVREYRERYPHKAVVAWHNGVGQVPALMAGAAQVLMRNPTAGHDQGRKIDRTPLDGFLREHLAADLPRMDVARGMVEEAGPSWALADRSRRTVLVASMAGPQIGVQGRLRGRRIGSGLWFSPKTGDASKLEQPVAAATLAKPDAGEWLLLLRLA